jgi:guanine deaminase
LSTLFRAAIFHTPRNPFLQADALEFFADGGLVVDGETITAVGDDAALKADEIVDLRPGVILPGFIDTHVHYPQARIIGALGDSLLDWLTKTALPEEARLANPAYAAEVADEFVRGLVSHGTTTALVFGAHFAPAMEVLFEATGPRIISGLVLSDRVLPGGLLQTPARAYGKQSFDCPLWRFAIRRDAAICLVGFRRDAGSLPDVDAGTSRGEVPDSYQREPRRDGGGRQSVSMGGGLFGDL